MFLLSLQAIEKIYSRYLWVGVNLRVFEILVFYLQYYSNTQTKTTPKTSYLNNISKITPNIQKNRVLYMFIYKYYIEKNIFV